MPKHQKQPALNCPGCHLLAYSCFATDFPPYLFETTVNVCFVLLESLTDYYSGYVKEDKAVLGLYLVPEKSSIHAFLAQDGSEDMDG